MADVEMGHGGLGEACGWFVLILYYNGREENAMRVSTLFPMADTLGVVILVALIALFADVIAQHVGPHAARSHQRRVRLGPPKLPRRACPPSGTMWKLSWHFPLGHCNIISKQTSRRLPPNLHAPFPHQPSRPATSLD